MKKLNIIFLLGLFFFAAAVFPSCKKEEITNIEYSVLWKGSLETAPANPEAGWAYYNTKLGQSFIYDGASWQVMSENGKDGKDGEIPTDYVRDLEFIKDFLVLTYPDGSKVTINPKNETINVTHHFEIDPPYPWRE